jgi:hypothetical protein
MDMKTYEQEAINALMRQQFDEERALDERPKA